MLIKCNIIEKMFVIMYRIIKERLENLSFYKELF